MSDFNATAFCLDCGAVLKGGDGLEICATCLRGYDDTDPFIDCSECDGAGCDICDPLEPDVDADSIDDLNDPKWGNSWTA